MHFAILNIFLHRVVLITSKILHFHNPHPQNLVACVILFAFNRYPKLIDRYFD